jgi:hypothetical protein
MKRILAGIAAGFVASVIILQVAGLALGHARTTTRLVAESASAPLGKVAIHYAPAADRVANGVWKQLFAVLPASVDVEVEIAAAADYDRFMRVIHPPHPERFHPVVVGAPITTWSRDRYAALVDDSGAGSILAPPRIETPFVGRAGDARSPGAISRALYGREPHIANIVFEGGDLAATPRFIFADVNLAARNLGRADADRGSIERELRRRFAQQIIWLGNEVGDVPRHHIMMYMVPLDDTTIAVGDVRAGAVLYAADPMRTPIPLGDLDAEARRFDRAAALLVAKGFRVVRVPALVLEGAGSYVTYTNALFDRRADGTRVVYLPTYDQPALDHAARAFYLSQGFDVRPIDVAPIYQLNGSLGCLVNVLARG